MSYSQQDIAFQAPEPALLAQLFPGYDIECLIATGGMGAVYRAVQRSLDRVVALKILPLEFSADTAFCEAFEAEAKAMARLNHPNLIGVYDFGEVNGMLFIIMEYVHGQSLHHSANGRAIDSKEVIRLIVGIGNGLAHAHEHGILHRDIKPANILLDLNAQPKIGDFGLARPVERQVHEGEDIFGTPHYTAPEVVESPQSVGYRADIFSLGVMLHELLTGKLPAEDPRNPSEIIGCDRRFDQVVRRATYPDPQFRYSSAAELVRDLEAINDSAVAIPIAVPAVTKATVVSAPVRVPRKTSVYQPKRRSGFPSGLMFLLLLGLGGGGYYYWKKHYTPGHVAPSVAKEEPVIPQPAPPREKPFQTPSSKPSLPPEDAPASTPFGTAEPSNESSPAPEAGRPKFDVDGFLTRGRRGMQQFAKSPLAAYEQAMRANCQAFEGKLAVEARRLGTPKRETVMKALADDYEKWKENGYRIPTSLPSIYDDLKSSEAIHGPALEKQEQLGDALAVKLRSFAPTYIKGIQKQIDALRTQDDPHAIRLLEGEINKVKDEPDYMAELLAGKKTDTQASANDGWIIPD